jgi:glycosyltransferase involved in cell wall biosynthesis
MQTNRQKQRKILIVMERGLENPSAMVAGLQYKELFEQRAGYSVRYENLIPHFSHFSQRVMHYGRLLHLSTPVDLIDARCQKYHEDRLVEYAADCDMVFAIKIPSLEFYRRLKRLTRPKILTCISDGLWLPFFRRAGWHDLEDVLRISDGVTCESEYMANFVRRYNSRIFFVPDSPQIESFDPWRSRIERDPNRIVLGWVGSPNTATALYKIWEPLEELFGKYLNLHLRIVGSNQTYLPRFEKVTWSAIPSYNQEIMVQEVLKMDIGLFPLFTVEESLARGILKPMIYMSGEVAAICQNLGDSRDLISNGINGMLADSSQEWLEKLEWLINNCGERKRISKNGLDTIRNRFTRNKCFEQLVNAIEALC